MMVIDHLCSLIKTPITTKIPIFSAWCQVRSILFLLATFEDEALLMAKSLPDQAWPDFVGK